MKYAVLALLGAASAKRLNGVPVLVDPVVMENSEASSKLDIDMRVGPDDVSVAKRPHRLVEIQGVPVLVDPIVMENTEADSNLELKMMVGPDEVSVAKNRMRR